MNALNHASLAEEYKRHRESLLADFPELADDPVTLADTLDGITSVSDEVAKYIRHALEDNAMAAALTTRIEDMGERRQRLEARAAKRRAIALALMNAADMPRLEQPDFTASARHGSPKVTVTDETRLPDRFVRVVTTKSPDKIAIRDALAKGLDVPGAVLGNGAPTLSVRTK